MIAMKSGSRLIGGAMNEARVNHHKTFNNSWNLGDGLWWREWGPTGDRIWGMVLTREPEFGPKGGRLSPGFLTEINAPSMDALNRVLAELGFGALGLQEDEIRRFP